jgi:transcriptional regulator with XRE-family HTH domain
MLTSTAFGEESCLITSPFGTYLREKRTAAGKSLREVADALSISHVYLGEIERGRRRILPKKYWKRLAACVPGISRAELEDHAAASEPIDPAAIEEGPSRHVVVALARRLEEDDIPESLARELVELLEKRGRDR